MRGMKKRHRLFHFGLGVLVSLAAPPAFCGVQDSNGDENGGPAHAVEAQRIQELIGQLGSANYARREQAQTQLRQLGVTPFDALSEAQHADDIEIAMRSRRLLERMVIPWSHDDDPAAVKELLREYGSRSPSERVERVDRLAELPDGEGLLALCRVIRFDESNRLSKQAALRLLEACLEQPFEADSEWAAGIRNELGLSVRQAADWVRTYVRYREEVDQLLVAWDGIVRAELDRRERYPEASSEPIIRDLLRWQIRLLEQEGRLEQAEPLVRQMIELLDTRPESLLETVDWLMERGDWPTILQVAARFEVAFEGHAPLLYRLAEAQLELGDVEAAGRIAERALQAQGDESHAHLSSAFRLQERGRFEWAEREYRHVLEVEPIGAQHNLRTRLLLSEMLHDLGRHGEAGEALQPAVEALATDQNLQSFVRRVGREPASIHSRMCYFFGQDALKRGQIKEQRGHLEEGVGHDPTDPDLLIAMYRFVEADDEWRDRTIRYIEAAVEQHREEIRTAERAADAANNEEVRSSYLRQVATLSNQMAWLVSNTRGDFEDALRRSQRSLEIRPETAAYLDTLARCYYALGDIDQAVQVQRRALEREPFSGQLRGQLDYFLQALEASEPTAGSEANPPDEEP